MSIESYLILKGFIIPGNEIYGGKNGWYDYGHLGVMLKKNISRAWERYFVLTKPNVYFLDSGIFNSEETLKSSGHIGHFNDILIDCKSCKRRYRVDHLEKRVCSFCGGKDFTEPKPFNLMFRTQDDNYLRPETAQSIFINFKNILRTTGAKIPFGVGQIGKSFRNEVTLSHSIFRTKEFEQMELEWFLEPNGTNETFEVCLKQMNDFLIEELGMNPENIRNVEIEDRAHYSSRSTDIEFLFPHGWGELWGLANRTDFDLKAHSQNSIQALDYVDPFTNEKYTPHVVEHSVGLNRLMYALIVDSYENTEDRELLKIKYDLAPYRFCILPLTKNELNLAKEIHQKILNLGISCWFLEKGSIGKRYRKNDSIGTPYCITIDQDSLQNLENPIITIRDRDSKNQIKISLGELEKNEFKFTFG